MATFYLNHLGRNVISMAGRAGLVVRNVSGRRAAVYVDVKCGSTWTPWSGRVTLEPDEAWSRTCGEVPGELLLVVALAVADGRNGDDGGRADNGRNVVEVEY
ncbi:hypothetical protein [Longimicrobium sp.]|uniref:hypothetical protein n=1 Tax=Longimicrobium sp. TaxID=2029185 RepID=UPI003B3B8C8F